MTRQPYPTDLTDEQWLLVEPLIPPAKPGGRDREADMREILNSVLHLVRGGHAWCLVPHDFGIRWNTCYQYYRGFVRDGTWTAIDDALRGQVRAADGREPTPSAAILDSQTVKTAKKGARRSATTPARRSGAASATCSSTPSGW